MKFGKFDARRRKFPVRIDDAAAFDSTADQAVFDCFEPEKPFITRDTPIVAAGSCFAGNISAQLGKAGYGVSSIGVLDRLFTPPAVRDFIRRAIVEEESVPGLSADWLRVEEQYVSAAREKIRKGAVVIITFGLSTVWVDKQAGTIILDPTVKLPKGILLAPTFERYEMKQMAVGEIVDCIKDTIASLRSINAATKFVLTLSPIPLVYSGSDYPVVAADCLSKSSLRVALDEVLRLKMSDVYYYPSYELLKWMAPMVDTIWGADGLSTHIREPWIEYALAKFRQFYCVEQEPTPVPPPPTLQPF